MAAFKKDEKKKGGGKPNRSLLMLLLLVAAFAGLVGAAFKFPEFGSKIPLLKNYISTGKAGNGEAPKTSGTWAVRVVEVRLADVDLEEGEDVDIQIRVLRKEGDDWKEIWDSEKAYNRANEGEAGNAEKPLVAVWDAKETFLIDWKPGDAVRIEIWDRMGGEEVVARWESTGGEFLADGGYTHTFTDVYPDNEGKKKKAAGKHTIRFESNKAG